MRKMVLVAGAGTMGRGIAELMALSGFEVQLWDHHPATLGKASAAIERSLRKQHDIGRVTDDELDAALERIRLISDLHVVNPRTPYVIEAVVEDLEIKRQLLARAERELPDAWYATHTASLSIPEIALALKRPERLIGLHFFYPATVIPLVEIVYWLKTDESWLRHAVELVEYDLGKQTIVVKDSPGFVTNRLGVAMALEAMRMVEQGVASVADIDKAMEYGYRHPMGPLRQSDWVGLDVRLSVARILYEKLGTPTFKPPKILEEMVQAGRLGRKSGEGFYKWQKD
ncbi:MAG: 3-hydroxyacyl-CoA dehydrogenase family protein [Deltaproteobacteria bacterium]|nr:3-hydroxyacyl-CoA dehydrogenase family protein [Deltaproteobacteria bacterium]